MTYVSEHRLGELVSRLEDLELPLLSWGVVDGFLSVDDVTSAIDDQRGAAFARGEFDVPATDEYLDLLIQRNLLFRLPTGEERYRTRFAEQLRLLRLLRQLWPPADPTADGWWRRYATLVADYRLWVGPRRYPRRDVPAEAVRDDLRTLSEWSPTYEEILSRVVGASSLARFQLRAARAVLTGIAADRPTAQIVTAGTGSGKTLAFYLPAVLDIAATMSVRRRGPHTLALYPRIELLRDQAREAMLLSERIGPLVRGGRGVRVGLLYGGTPSNIDFEGPAPRGWTRTNTGWTSPYFPCLSDGCAGSMAWLDRDRRAGTERLTCSICGRATESEAIALTRQSITQRPPDILFTTTEMLSKQSTSGRVAEVLGWKGPNGTRLVLLDEVHTYSGVHGAQVAYTLRRWRHANRQYGSESVAMVGLSATLRDAGQFFSDLTGVDRSNVDLIAPTADELDPISREYGVVLRGDPLSGAPLLSTTIQTLMLLGRMLDRGPSQFGSIAFAFTDDLDVVNRLYDNLHDAEGHSQFGRSRGEILGRLRDPGLPQTGARYEDGQSWDMASRLGRMASPLRVARTSSQDSGVDVAADVVVATSSLEVGFNDPRVGVVVQHKAPRDMASFLQRRGRAGRRLEMRPLTAVVLSDFGRDHAAYQEYERLLSPEIGVRSLPVGNRFVIKIQATHALLDWLARVTGRDTRAAAAPPRPGHTAPDASAVVELLRQVVDSEQRQDEVMRFIQRALSISVDDAEAVMWEEPRSVMLSVVPTLLKRLEREWKVLPGSADPGAILGTPLPEFLTATLFSALNTPDVVLAMPPDFRTGGPETMPVLQALREAVPGRVSRRFGYAHASHRTWLPLAAHGVDVELTTAVSKGHALGTWTMQSGEEFFVVRPLEIQLQVPPPEVADTSGAQAVWRSLFEYQDASLHDMDVPSPSPWSEFVAKVAFALHVAGGPLMVRRMCVGAQGELALQRRSGIERRAHTTRYAHQGSPAALGFELEVDAFIVSGVVPKEGQWVALAQTSAWRTLAFRSRVLSDTRLDGIANMFQRRWLIEVYLHAHVNAGLTNREGDTSSLTLADGEWTQDLIVFLGTAYRSDNTAAVENQRVLVEIERLAADPDVRSVVEEHSRLLTAADIGVTTQDLYRQVFVDTLATAILDATFDAIPDAQEGDLVADVQVDHDSNEYRIFVSETAIGGLGIMEALHQAYALDPRRFWERVGRAVAPTDVEDTDRALQIALAALVENRSPFARAVADFRAARDASTLDEALHDVRREWEALDGPPSHLTLSTFSTRFLRPGSHSQIDAKVNQMVQVWIDLERRLGVEIDPRTLVYHADQGTLGIPIRPLTLDSAYSMLWARGHAARNKRLQYWNPYREDLVVERLVLESLVADNSMIVDISQQGWQSSYMEAVQRDGAVRLHAAAARNDALARAIRECLVTPIERAGLRVYARVIAVTRCGTDWLARMDIAEELQ
ncbi:protein DpdJ [Nocardia cyriacigeorgica]|uniref:protein DpdJ n=1 Tax=Nocardia cyriacigeorgica TaxID=135487 RepID=UPI001893521B|nr:protein DpdJ [Nocardia cyriacigeorgica]MBF6414624.1 DEAD/DEAH box helicase [Nocardia cyriacigeorgica]